MRIGTDLDNTLINYDALFHAAALERGLIAKELPARKTEVKNWVQGRHGNDAWTELQAEVYGPLLEQAEVYPGAMAFFRRCRSSGFSVCVISHKTRFPALGRQHDLRAAAMRWLEQRGWFGADGIHLDRSDVEFHDTRAAKVQAIRRRACDLFIDDLPEVFAEEAFPTETTRILFDPDGAHAAVPNIKKVGHWSEVEDWVFASNAGSTV